MQRKLRKMIS